MDYNISKYVSIYTFFGGRNRFRSIRLLTQPGAILPSKRVLLCARKAEKPPAFLRVVVPGSAIDVSSFIGPNSTGKSTSRDYGGG